MACIKCDGVGIVFYDEKVNGILYTFGARCTCSTAAKFSARIPCIDRIMPPEMYAKAQVNDNVSIADSLARMRNIGRAMA